jgi:hypothetical protein
MDARCYCFNNDVQFICTEVVLSHVQYDHVSKQFILRIQISSSARFANTQTRTPKQQRYTHQCVCRLKNILKNSYDGEILSERTRRHETVCECAKRKR